jgi:hypothetical protein
MTLMGSNDVGADCDEDWATAELNDEQNGSTGARITLFMASFTLLHCDHLMEHRRPHRPYRQHKLTPGARFHAGEGPALNERFLWIDHHSAAAAAADDYDEDWAAAELNDTQDGRTGAKITRPLN